MKHMAGRLTPLGVAAKWVLAPLAIGLFGYLAISPFVGHLPKRVKEAGRAAMTKISTVAEKAKPKPDASVGPQVDIQVESSAVRPGIDGPKAEAPAPMVDASATTVTTPPVDQPKPRKPRKRKHRVEPNTLDESATATEKAPDPEKADPASSGAISNP